MFKTFLKIFAFSLLFAFTLSSNAQQYKTGLGLRGGYPSGITLKHFMTKSTAIEGVLSVGWGYYGVTGLYQIHNPIPDAEGFKWYYGIGGHLASSKSDRKTPWASATGETLYLGVDGVLGAEYVFPDAPISISLDILPILNIIQEPGVWFNAGLSVRYILK